jgi:hypothetical protein
MATIKNEHIVYAYAPILDGGNLLLVGITDIGWEYLKKESGNYLHANPPSKEFSNVKEVWIVRGKDKQEIRDMMKTVADQMKVPLSFPH